jgi:uncharacterized protein
MDELCEISMLLDFYGQLITQRQYEILDLHYNSDYSFGEIAQYLKISRQGVYDNIKKGKATLSSLEQKLKLVGRFSEQRSKAKEILELLGGIEVSSLSKKDSERLSTAQHLVRQIMED